MATLRHIIAMKNDAITPELETLAKSSNIQLHKFYDLVEYGQKYTQKDIPPKPDDTYIIW